MKKHFLPLLVLAGLVFISPDALAQTCAQMGILPYDGTVATCNADTLKQNYEDGKYVINYCTGGSLCQYVTKDTSCICANDGVFNPSRDTVDNYCKNEPNWSYSLDQKNVMAGQCDNYNGTMVRVYTCQDGYYSNVIDQLGFGYLFDYANIECFPCPPHPDDHSDDPEENKWFYITTGGDGIKSRSDCQVVKDTTFTDGSGTYTITEDCYY